MVSQETMMIESFVRFATKLYSSMTKEQKDIENVFFSPLSIYTALGMTLVGATGATQTEMRQALEIPDTMSDEEVHKSISKEFLEKFNGESDVQISVANRIFLCICAQIHLGFTDICKQMYSAEVGSLHSLPTDAAKVAHINAWVSEATRGKIDHILPPNAITQDTVCILINALFFKGNWQTPFNTSFTRMGPFIRLDGQSQETPLMFLNGHFLIANLPELDARALRFPFRGLKWNLLIILPNKVDGLPKMLTKLQTPESLIAVMASSFTDENVNIWLPKMKLGYGKEIMLEKILKLMGLHRLFSLNQCELGNLCTDRRVAFDSVVHKAIFEADEQGATAAAVTGFAMADCAMMPSDPPIEFRVDHPFFIALLYGNDFPSFIGHVAAPE